MPERTRALVAQPHERRVQRFAYVALGLVAALGLWLALRSPGRLLGLDVPLGATLGLVALGAVVGLVAVARRATPLALAACALLVLGVAPGGDLAPGAAGYAAGFLFGALLLAFGELVHMTTRYDKAHKLVEEEGVPEESLDRVTDEAVKTLATRAGLALALALGAALAAVGLARWGPPALREGLETAAPLGVAVVALLVLSALSLYVLARGSRLRRDEETAAPDAAYRSRPGDPEPSQEASP